jgi:CheY-like chemotaxis protein
MAKILIVDDEAANRLLVVTLLQYAGHQVLEAANGEDALETVKAARPDLVIVDLFLPGMHGTQLVKALRALPEAQATRIALYSGTHVDATLADFMAVYRVEHVIPKPSEPEDLLRIVNGALGGEATSESP